MKASTIWEVFLYGINTSFERIWKISEKDGMTYEERWRLINECFFKVPGKILKTDRFLEQNENSMNDLNKTEHG